MKLKLAVGLTALLSLSGANAMMGAPMYTSSMFPLIDGARYEYVFVSGPRATATAVVHAGQTWGGAAGLTGIHTVFTCRDTTTSCPLDTSEFYRMDPDGLRYFGGESETPDGSHFAIMLNSPDWMLKNPVSPGSMMGQPSTGAIDPETWQAAVSGMHSMLGAQSYSSSQRAEGLEAVTTPMGTFSDTLHVREQRGSGVVRDVWYAAGVGMVRWRQGDEEAVLASVVMPTGPVARVARAVEYYHPGLDHYFITAHAAEIAALDSGRFQGWQRTGTGFNVVDGGSGISATTTPVCRYYGNPAYGLESHFYSASPDECADVQRRWPAQWRLESLEVFRVDLPDPATGMCVAGSMPVYRALNGRADTNHRYTADARIQTSMMGRGYTSEGVVMCSPL